MTLTEIVSAAVVERIVWTLLHFVWQGSAIAVGVLVGAHLVGRDMPRRYLVSVAGLLLMIVSPLATFAVLSSVAPASAEQGALFAGASPSAWSLGEASTTSALVDENTEAASPYLAATIARLAPWLLAAWLVGVALLFGRLLLSVVAVGWLKRSGRRAGEVVQEQTKRLSRKLRVALPPVRVSARVSQAMVAGFFRPVIILPAAWLAQLPPDCLEAILAHELAHIRRRDLWVNLLQRVVETFLFYHPAVWWLSQRLAHERELCCDELAVAATGRRVEYVSTLELVARRRAAHVAPLLAAGIGGGRMALLHRVKHILGLSPERDGISPWTVGVAALVAAGGCWWVASGMNPLWADEKQDESSLVAFDDGDGEKAKERDGHERGDGKREGERHEGHRERREGPPREGDRPHPPRDGDHPRADGPPREGDRPHPPGPPAEQFRRHIQALKERLRVLKEEGKMEDAAAVEKQIQNAMQRFANAHLGDHPQPPIPPEVREKAEELKRQLREAREAGNRERVGELERQLQELIRAHHPQGGPPADHPRPEGGPPGDAELVRVIRQLREEVNQLRREVNELRGGPPGPREGDRPRPEGPPPGDGPRGDGPPPRGDRPDFRPDRPRPEGGRPGPRPEGRRPDGPPRERPEGDRPERERPDA